jgi:hypothetical protein
MQRVAESLFGTSCWNYASETDVFEIEKYKPSLEMHKRIYVPAG